jgi:hypothetical protein
MAETIPPTLQNLLYRELARGERVLWQARPAPISLVFASGRTFLFGIPFFAFALFWTWTATHGFEGPRSSGKPGFGWFGYLWGGMFMVFGAQMLLSPLWAWWVARHTLYAVTDRRALLIEVPLGRVTVQSFSGERLLAVARRENSSGRGDLIFERVMMRGAKGSTHYRDIGFFGISDARGVERLLPTPDAARAEPAVRGRRDA